MRIAIVIDDLIQRGGQEKLFVTILEMFPNAHVFTALSNEYWKNELKKRNICLANSFIDNLPFKKKLNKLYALLFFYNLAFESFDFTNYDVVLSISARFAHVVITKPSTIHICYLNSPGRMIWHFQKYLSNNSFVLRVLTLPHRILDYYSSKRVDYFIANSRNVLNRIKKYYGRQCIVIYPFFEIPTDFSQKNRKNFFIVISRIAQWKRIDLAIEACIKLNKNLKVVGDSEILQKWKNKYKKFKNIEFLGYISDEDKIKLLDEASALIFTQEEDFGITPLEALARACPVIAYKKGGALETVSEDTGVFFDQQNVDSLVSAINTHLNKTYNKKSFESSMAFTKARFTKSLFDFINNIYLNNKKL